MDTHVGELLTVWRTRRRLTQAHLAGRAGINRSTLARWEAGQTQPRLPELEAVLAALGVSPSQRQEALAQIDAPRAVRRLRAAAGDGPPLRGDLLRAMRRRQGWTQEETSRRTGIAQGTLARWERSDDWPSTERLHVLCHALHAHEAELAALTLGWATEPSEDRAFDPDRVRKTVSIHTYPSPLADVEFLALEAELWHWGHREEKAKRLQSHTYGSHARVLADQRRYAEAAVYVAHTHRMAQSGHRDDIGWASSVIAQSRIEGRGGRVPDPKRAIGTLRAAVEDPFLSGRTEYRAWMQSEIAKHLVSLGEPAAALTVSREAVRMGADQGNTEAWCRRGDHARVLVGCGYGVEALDECRTYLGLGYPPIENLPFVVTGAQALVATGHPSEAVEWFQQAKEIIATQPEASHIAASEVLSPHPSMSVYP